MCRSVTSTPKPAVSALVLRFERQTSHVVKMRKASSVSIGLKY